MWDGAWFKMSQNCFGSFLMGISRISSEILYIYICCAGWYFKLTRDHIQGFVNVCPYTFLPHPMSDPMRECLRSMARACALVRFPAASPLMARMRSPTPKRPSRLMAPPWMILRISIPTPSFTAQTVIPGTELALTCITCAYTCGFFFIVKKNT